MRLSPRSKSILLLVMAVVLSGCADYMNRRDSVTLRAGDAIEANTAIHVINPSPPIAYDRRAREAG